jgi:chromosome segregation ATPase
MELISPLKKERLDEEATDTECSQRSRIDAFDSEASTVQMRTISCTNHDLDEEYSNTEGGWGALEGQDDGPELCARLQGQVEGAQKEIDRQYAALKSRDKSIKRLENECQALRRANTEADRRVKELDAVALGLENELSAAEIQLEKFQESDVEKQTLIKDFEIEIADLKNDLEAREWRIEDLKSQVNDLREAAAEAAGNASRAEKAYGALQQAYAESEKRYNDLVRSNMESLQAMESKVLALKEVASTQGSNEVETQSEAPAPHAYEMTVESQRQVIEDLSNRISGLEQDYRQAKILCRSLENENAELRKRLEENARMREARELSFKQTEEDMVNKFDQFKVSYSEKLVAAENKAAAELEKALERAHAEAQTKRQAAISSALDAQKMELEGKYKKKILHAENERDELSKSLTKMQKEYDILSIENQNSLKEAQQWMEEAKQKKVLEKEKQALCSVIQDLQNALTRAEEHISRNRNTGRSNNGEKENQMESLSPIKASKHATKGTPLRSLPVN